MSLVTVERTKKYLILRIPLGVVERDGQKIIDEAIERGLNDIKDGKTFGPFQSVREFKQALRSPIKK